MSDAPGPFRTPDDDRDAPDAGDEAGRRAERALAPQILATEHWSLLASRSTTQAEVLTRIAIYLTLVSAGLLGIGLLGQASDFGDWFAPAALGILAFVWLVGFLTQVRVMNVANEDMMYVVAMNRIRGAYRELKPGVERNFLASIRDDEPGIERTYYFFGGRGVSQVIGSSARCSQVSTASTDVRDGNEIGLARIPSFGL